MEEKIMTKITVTLISVFLFLVTGVSSYTAPKSTSYAGTAIGDIRPSTHEISYQDISTEKDYLSLVEAGENNLKSTSAYEIDDFWLAVDSEHSLFAMQAPKGAIFLLSGKDFCLTPTEVWYTSNNGVKHFNYADAYFMYLDRGTLLNPDGIDIDELLKTR